MRELKFRAWDKQGKHWYPAETMKDFFNYLSEKFVIIADWFNKDVIILEQYTGLKDKNGTEIYEGDIVMSDDGSRYLTGAVEWNEDYAKYEVIYNQLTGNSFEFEGDDGYPVADLCEVIGNIHENQDLLDAANTINKEEE